MTNIKLDPIREIFAQSGPLADKLDALERLYDSGDSMLFDGRLYWSVELLAETRRVEGESESMDDAVQSMLATLRLFAQHYGSDTPVQLDIRHHHDAVQDADGS